jgi:hypothetical protein
VGAVIDNGMSDNRETESGATGLAASGLIDPVEAFEDSINVASRDTNSMIGDLNYNFVAL